MSRNDEMESLKEKVRQDLISVVVPVYNIESYLDRCIKSVVEQTYSKLQIILVDDRSTDGSAKICDRWKEEDERIEVYHRQNGGVSRARNQGMQMAKGEWLIFIDGDDWIEPEMLEKMHQKAIENQAEVAVCSLIYEYKEMKEMKEMFSVFKTKGSCYAVISGEAALESMVNRQASYGLGFSACNKLFRKNIISEITFAEGRIRAEDMLFVVKALCGAKRCVLLSDGWYHYYVDRKNNSTSRRSSLQSVQDDMELREIRTEYLYQNGLTELGDWSQDELLYALLTQYCFLASKLRARDVQMKYIRSMLKKPIEPKNRRTKLGLFLYRISPRFFVWVMKKRPFLG